MCVGFMMWSSNLQPCLDPDLFQLPVGSNLNGIFFVLGSHGLFALNQTSNETTRWRWMITARCPRCCKLPTRLLKVLTIFVRPITSNRPMKCSFFGEWSTLCIHLRALDQTMSGAMVLPAVPWGHLRPFKILPFDWWGIPWRSVTPFLGSSHWPFVTFSVASGEKVNKMWLMMTETMFDELKWTQVGSPGLQRNPMVYKFEIRSWKPCCRGRKMGSSLHAV